MSKITRCENLYYLLGLVDDRFIEEVYSEDFEKRKGAIKNEKSNRLKTWIKRKWVVACSFCLLFVIGLSVLIYAYLGGFVTLVERVETKAVKTVFEHIEKTQKQMQGDYIVRFASDNLFNSLNLSYNTNLTYSVGEDVDELMKESYDEQANAVFYCKLAVYIYESIPQLLNDKVYISKVENGKGEFKVIIEKSGDNISMKTLYRVGNEYSYVNLLVDYDSENKIFNKYKIQELNSLNKLTVYYENEYIARSKDLTEIGRLYSVKYNENEKDYYLFQNDANGTISFKNGDTDSIVTTQKGEKPVIEIFKDLKNELDEEISVFNNKKSVTFNFSYRLALKYAMENGSFGHKATISNKQDGIKVPVTFVGSGKEEGAIVWVALDGYILRPFFPLREGTYQDDYGNEWFLEGYYYDQDFENRVDKENIPYMGQIEMTIYMKWIMVE